MLLVCATPIGNLGDVTPRVLDALRAADLIAAEDTRHTRKLLAHFGIHTPTTSFFSQNEARRTEQVLQRLREGQTVALVSDAGMPGISDPGARLVARAVDEDLPLTVLPGPSAVTTALVLSGFAGDQGFRFVGYLPRRARELQRAFDGWRQCGGVVVAFDTGQRLANSLAVLAAYLPEIPGAVCRELTKVHEEVVRGTLLELSDRFPIAGPDATHNEGAVRGEIVLVLDLGPGQTEAPASPERAARAAEALLARGLSRRDTAAALHVCLGLPRRDAERIARETAAGGAPGA